MKKVITLVYLVIITSTVFAQNATLPETQDFIKKYIEAFPQNNGNSGGKNDVAFMKDPDYGYFMVYSNYMPDLIQEINTFRPADIQSIIIDRNTLPSNAILKIKIKYGSHVMVQYGNMKENTDHFDIILGSASFSENYPERIQKALIALVKLCGGNISEDKY